MAQDPRRRDRPSHSKTNDNDTTLQQKRRNWEQNFKTPQSRSSKDSGNLEMSKSLLYSTLQQHPHECLCQDCTCGRHLCKLEASSLPFSMVSSYKLHYPPRTPYRQREATRPASARVPETPLLTGKSTYLDDFTEVAGDPLQRPKPDDLLKCRGGPGAELTSYKEEYPGHRGRNQHVPMNPELFRGGLNFGSNSTYSKEFQKPRGQSAGSARPPDQFQMTGAWLGKSSYETQFQNPGNYQKRGKGERTAQSQRSSPSSSSHVKEKNPSTHFKTTYGSDFVGSKGSGCPAAKKVLEASQDLSKSAFKENSNFRGMDSHYSSLARYANQF